MYLPNESLITCTVWYVPVCKISIDIHNPGHYSKERVEVEDAGDTKPPLQFTKTRYRSVLVYSVLTHQSPHLSTGKHHDGKQTWPQVGQKR